MKKTLITNGLIVTVDETFTGSVLIEDGVIADVIRSNEIPEADEIIDADGFYIIPGAIDPHVHMELETPYGTSCDDFYSGTKAALAGGTTTIIDFITPGKGEKMADALKKRKKAAAKSLIDYGLHASFVNWNDHTEREIDDCIRNHGISSFKLYLAYQKSIGIDDKQLALIMEAVGNAGGMVMLHCEDDALITHLQKKYLSEGKTAPEWHPKSRPVEAEATAVLKAISYAKILNCPLYIVHVSGAPSIQLIAEAQDSGIRVLAETCPQYLLLDEQVYSQSFAASAKFVMSPPLRGSFDRFKLWKALKDKTISVVATDHCPFNFEGQKANGAENFTLIPNGAGGVEHRPALLFTSGVLPNRLSLNDWVALISTNPARIFGLSHKKGAIQPGLDADIVIWNPDKKHIISAKNHYQRCDSNIYEGLATKGAPEMVLLKGKIVFSKNEFYLDGIQGEYLNRQKPIME
ncbi:MAG: dihydropyrimidinase [Bacteroidales bacterium]|nr:dihydropyrimidinase [Bacteroidales bacterium]